jgi:uncharacterized membrane protein YkvA (DUF1232 family)
MLQRIKEWARAIRRDVHALWLAARDPRTPWYAKAFALAIAAYALSPIDLIPDFIPILGYADHAIVVVLVLRSVCRRVSLAELREAWPGTDDGFAALCRLVRPSAVAQSPHSSSRK